MCNKSIEYVEVRDGGTIVSRLIDRYCVPPTSVSTIKTTSNFMFVRFVTASGGSELSIFKAKVDINDCGATHYVDYYYNFKLPNFPNNYTNRMECDFYIRASKETASFRINITKLDMPASDDCSSGDYIEFREEGPTGDLIGRFCGVSAENTTISVNSMQSVVFASFKSDSSYTGKGFLVDFYVVETGETIAH